MNYLEMKARQGDHGVEPVAEGFRIFESEEFGQVRVVVGKDGEPWFVANDVCEALGIYRTQIRRLDDDEKGVRYMHTPGGDQKILIINESGLYHLTITSRKDFAKRFRKWLTGDIAPTIRKHGAYATQDFVEKALLDPDIMIQAMEQIKQERQARLEAESDAAHFKATKQWISDKKTATAMGRLGGVIRDRNRLKRENELLKKQQVVVFPENPIDYEAKYYKQAKAIDWLQKYLEMSRPGAYSTVGKALTQLSGEMGIPYRALEDSRFGQVNAYHVSVIEEFQNILKTDRTYLWRLRVDNRYNLRLYKKQG